jgi:peptidoglycan hydrolase-like protein with peptidoglycan-binding domain
MAGMQTRPNVARATPAIVAILAVLVVGGCQKSSSSSSSPTAGATPLSGTTASGGASTTTTASSPSTTAAAPSTTSTTRPPTTTTLPRPTTTTVPPPSTGALRVGSSGAEVMQMQQRLSSLGYWLGTPDGRFGSTTQQALFALQKAAGISRSGVRDPATAAALDAGTKPTPKSASGHLIEVDLARQLVLIVTSTGGGYVYYDHGARQVAITPTGHFTTTWEVNGTRVSSLGVLWRPKYFVGGIAIHGDSSVPARPVSHGCVRVSNQAIDWIWASGSDPIGTSVWVY